jgi:hypothetical protein
MRRAVLISSKSARVFQRPASSCWAAVGIKRAGLLVAQDSGKVGTQVLLQASLVEGHGSGQLCFNSRDSRMAGPVRQAGDIDDDIDGYIACRMCTLGALTRFRACWMRPTRQWLTYVSRRSSW